VVYRDLQLPVCRNAVVESWGNDIGNMRLQKIEKSTCFGGKLQKTKKVVLLYEPQQNKLSFEAIIFWGGGFFQKWKKRI
jgi:hypothetical protein